MEQANGLPVGFVTTDEAVALIKSDSKERPVVDIDYMISRLKWIDVGRNFRIPKVRRLAPDEVYMSPVGRPVEYEEIGEVYVQPQSSFEKELLIKTLQDQYHEEVGHEYKEAVVKSMSTVADDAVSSGNSSVSSIAVQPRRVKNTTAVGTPMVGGEITSNGEGLSI